MLKDGAWVDLFYTILFGTMNMHLQDGDCQQSCSSSRRIRVLFAKLTQTLSLFPLTLKFTWVRIFEDLLIPVRVEPSRARLVSALVVVASNVYLLFSKC